MTAIPAELDSSVNCLEERLGIDAGNNEISLVNGLRPLSRGAYADFRERMADTGEGEDSSGRVPEHETTANAFIRKQL